MTRESAVPDSTPVLRPPGIGLPIRLWLSLIQIATGVATAIVVGWGALHVAGGAILEQERLTLEDMALMRGEEIARDVAALRAQVDALGEDRRIRALFFELMAAHVEDGRAGGGDHLVRASDRLRDEMAGRAATLDLDDLWIVAPDGTILSAASGAALTGRRVADVWTATATDPGGRSAGWFHGPGGRAIRAQAPIAARADRVPGAVVAQSRPVVLDGLSSTGSVRFTAIDGAVDRTAIDPSVLAARVPVETMGSTLTLSAYADSDVFRRPMEALADRIRRDTILASAALVVIVLILGAVVSRRTRQLVRGARRMEMGDLGGLDLPVHNRDEVGEVARALTNLAAQLAAGRDATEAALFHSAALEAASAAILIAGADGRLAYVSPAARDLMARFSHGDWPVAPGDPIAAVHPGAARTPGAGSREIAAGSGIVESHAAPIIDAEGRRRGTVIELVDATERRRLSAMMGAIDGSLLVAEIDAADGTMLRLNARAAGVFTEGAPIPIDDAALATVRASAAKDEPALMALAFDGPDGRPRHLAGSFSALRDRTGALVNLLGLFADTTAETLATAAAEAERDRLEAEGVAAVDALREGLAALAAGDLTQPLPILPGEAHGDLHADFEAARLALAEALASVRVRADRIGERCAALTASGIEIGRRTDRQTGELEATAAGLARETAALRAGAALAAKAEGDVRMARADAEASQAVVARTAAAMTRIADASSGIDTVLDVIEQIAFETDLLALNAGIAASRAGEAGRGFATVAAEIRALARRATDATGEIAALLRKSTATVGEGVRAVSETEDALTAIASRVDVIAVATGDLAATAQRQSDRLDDVSHTLSEIDRATQETTEMLDAGVSETRTLRGEVDALLTDVACFEVGSASYRPWRGLGAGGGGDDAKADAA